MKTYDTLCEERINELRTITYDELIILNEKRILEILSLVRNGADDNIIEEKLAFIGTLDGYAATLNHSELLRFQHIFFS